MPLEPSGECDELYDELCDELYDEVCDEVWACAATTM
jgi:hypothetical protein